mmetsp:Transcript_46775/g.105792  ORF Transcript_46775/g.105792 Transcript_46775/m.105792 type:complete len:217 (-) Transcript_46775:851-1501(-)
MFYPPPAPRYISPSKRRRARRAPLVVDHVLGRGGKLLVALDDLLDRVEEVLLGDGLPPRTDGEHAGLGAHAPELGARGVGAEAREELVPDVPVHRHGLGVDLEDVRAALEVGEAELHLAVEAAGAEQRRVEGVGAVCGHEDLDVPPRVEAVELRHNLEHGALHLIVRPPVLASGGARPADGVHLVEEDDARFLGSRHCEELTNHARALADVFLDKL